MGIIKKNDNEFGKVERRMKIEIILAVIFCTAGEIYAITKFIWAIGTIGLGEAAYHFGFEILLFPALVAGLVGILDYLWYNTVE